MTSSPWLIVTWLLERLRDRIDPHYPLTVTEKAERDD